MPTELIGRIAGLATSLCFSAGSVFFTLASRQIGPLTLNRVRLVIALLYLWLAHWLLYSEPFPSTANETQWLWLGLSGVIGLALGDLFLFQGFALIGPRLTMLMMSISPILTAILAWVFMHERLSPGQILGIAITIGGVASVVSERTPQVLSVTGNHRSSQSFDPIYLRGILSGLGAAACQSLGLVLARQGLGANFPALQGNFIRMLSAAAAIWLITLLQRQAGSTIHHLRNHPAALRYAAAGAFIAPFLGVSLSLVAIQNAAVGVASTLMALPPIFLLPVGVLVFKERLGWQSIAGTFVAMGGITLLFLV
jgi:drug/metabolite transporter (DMT)-like permease